MNVAGKEIGRIGLGTNRLKHTQQNLEFLRDAVAAGIGMVDTAHLYTGGASEETIGAAGITGRDDCVIATKGGWGGAGHGRPEALHAEIEESLRRLQTDVIDLYYLHRVDPETPLEDSLGAIKEHVDAGHIRAVGLSEVGVEQIERGREVVPIAAVQNRYNVGEREHDAVIDHCEAAGIAFVPYYPMRGADRPAVEKLARERGVTPGQVALAWLLARSPVVLPIPGSLSLDHVRENLAALDIELTDEERAAL
jgi:aryl-alcohol dehydrogenase-like predicted oxidoreductase